MTRARVESRCGVPARRAALLLAVLLNAAPGSGAELPLGTIRLPPGFRIETYAADVPGARSMALSPGDILFVGSRDAGRVYAVLDRGKKNRADEIVTIASGMNMPNGVAFRDGALLVSDDKAGAIYRITYRK